MVCSQPLKEPCYAKPSQQQQAPRGMRGHAVTFRAALQSRLCSSAGAATAKCHRLVASKPEVTEISVGGWFLPGLSPWLADGHHLPVSSRDFPLCLSVSPLPLLIKSPCRRARPNSLISPEFPLERTSLQMQWHSEVLGGRALTYELGGTQFSPYQVSLPPILPMRKLRHGGLETRLCHTVSQCRAGT